MKKGFRWCPHCRNPHNLSEQLCAATGLYIDTTIHRTPGESFIVPGTIFDAKYRVLDVIGSGGMGTVFDAISLPLDRRVAVKVVRHTGRGDAGRRLLREVQILKKLQHPNICDVYDAGTLPDGTPYVVLERLYGITLGALVARQRKLPIHEALDIYLQVLSGLQVAHSRNILHRDLKPHNIFVSPRLGCSPQATIVDFGLALDLGDVRITRPGMTCGTPHYMSPEQLRDEELDPRSDIFSAAVGLYEAITGVHPFVGASHAETRTRILRGEPVPLCHRRRSAPPALEAVIHWGLRKERSKRPASAQEFQSALREIDRVRKGLIVVTEDEDTTNTRPFWRPDAVSPMP